MRKIIILLAIMFIATSCISTNGNWSAYKYENQPTNSQAAKPAYKYKHLKCTNKKHKKKHKSLPPGLRKKIARGEPLPPGWQKKVICGEVLDSSIYENAIVLDIDDYPEILRYNPAAEVIKVHDKIIRIMKDTHEVLDILER